jgi:hypothetical protein
MNFGQHLLGARRECEPMTLLRNTHGRDAGSVGGLDPEIDARGSRGRQLINLTSEAQVR